MSVKDLFDNNGKYYRSEKESNKKSPLGHFVGQLVIAGLIFCCILYCYDREGTAGDAVRFAVAMATVDNGEMLAVDGNVVDNTEETLDTSAAYDGVTTEQGNLAMILPMSGVMEKSFGDIAEAGGTSDGIDIRSEATQKVKAAAAGTVSDITAYGNTYKILIKHNDIFESHYVNVETVVVKKGDKVMQGDKIGSMSQGKTLHFSVFKNGTPADPLTFLESPAVN